VTLRIS